MFIGTVAFTQDQVIQFSDTLHDFGSVLQSSGDIDHTFSFTNKGEHPLRISDVKADCGCTSPEWSEDSIAPGDTGIVKVHYEASSNPGSFYKTIKVYTEKDSAMISIKGFVEPTSSSEASYPEKAGDIWYKTAHLHYGNVIENKSYDKILVYFNQTADTLVLRFDTLDVPDFIELSADPDTLPPGNPGEVKVTYHAAKRGDLGYLVDHINLFPEEQNGNMEIALRATVLPYVPEMTEEERSNAPELVLDEESRSHNFGHINQTDTVLYTVGLMNGGNDTLKIRKLTSGCECIQAKVSNDEIPTNETSQLRITFIPGDRSSKQIKTVNIFTNDPKSPLVTITLTGYVRD